VNARNYKPHRFSVRIVLLGCLLAPMLDVWSRHNFESVGENLRLEDELSRERYLNALAKRELDSIAGWSVTLPPKQKALAIERMSAIYDRLNRETT